MTYSSANDRAVMSLKGYNPDWGIETWRGCIQAACVTDGTPPIVLSGSIPAGGYFLLERTDDDTVPGVAADLIYTGALSNDGEDLVLGDAASNVIDRVDCSAGWFAGHADARVRMVRVDTTADGSDADNWTHNPRCGTATNSAGIGRQCGHEVVLMGRPLDYGVYFNERAITATTTTTETTPMEDALLGFINRATASIDLAHKHHSFEQWIGFLSGMETHHSHEP